MPYLAIFRLNFEKTIAVFELSTFKFFKITFLQKQKIFQLVAKKALFGYL